MGITCKEVGLRAQKLKHLSNQVCFQGYFVSRNVGTFSSH
jgi:hypothetical protein